MRACVFFALLVPVVVMSGSAPPDEPCQLICPQDSTIPNEDGVCYASETFTLLFGSCANQLNLDRMSPTDRTWTGSEPVPNDRVACTPQSDGHIPIGNTSVCCKANLGIFLEPEPCCFQVTVEDVEPPVMTCPADIVRCNDADHCGAIVPFAVGACDNCGPVSTTCVDVDEGNRPVSPLGGDYFDVGVHYISCESKLPLMHQNIQPYFVDQHGLEQTCEFVIDVVDCQDPTIIEYPDIVVGNTPGECSAAVSFNVQVIDNCNATVECSPESGSIFDVGDTRVVCVAEDVIEVPNDIQVNTDEIAFDITVKDQEAPIVTCEETEGSETKSSYAPSFVPGFDFPFDSNPRGSLVEVSATDNCGPPAFVFRDSGVIVSQSDDDDNPVDHDFFTSLFKLLDAGNHHRRLLTNYWDNPTEHPLTHAPTSSPTNEVCVADPGLFGVGELFTSKGESLVLRIERNPNKNPTVKEKNGNIWLRTSGKPLVVAEDGAGNQACIECTIASTHSKGFHLPFFVPTPWQYR